jgi:hypothetical protein
MRKTVALLTSLTIAGLAFVAMVPTAEASIPPCFDAPCFATWCALNLGACTTPSPQPGYACFQNSCWSCAPGPQEAACWFIVFCINVPRGCI